MSETSQLERAQFAIIGQSGQREGEPLLVHFNPVSLQHTITNTLSQERGNARQYVSKSTGKLTMDLIFDTTDEGSDVRSITDQVVQFMNPTVSVSSRRPERKAPPRIEFSWGTYKFEGIVESYKETIDFFAPTGVPLRASINLTLARQDEVFEASSYGSRFDNQESLSPDQVEVPSSQPVGGAEGNNSREDTTSIATRSGDSRAGRAIAASNGQESMRFPSGPLTVDASVKLKPPGAFATGSMSLGASDGIGAGISGSLGAGVSAGISGGISGGLSGGTAISVTGKASAGISATGGAFAGLKTSGKSSSLRLEPSRLIPPRSSANLTTGAGASFEVGGVASIKGSASLKADVGGAADLRSLIQFEES